MSKSNEEEEDSLPPNQNTKPSSSLSQRPPLLTKSKTLTELRTTTTGPGGAGTNPLFSTVRRINTLTASASASSWPSDHALRVSVSSSIGLDQSSSSSSASYFSDRDYVYPSFLGAYPNRTRVHVKPRGTNPNPDRPIVVGDVKSAASPENHRITARNDINSRDSDSETDKLLVSLSSSVSQLGARRTREFNHSLILYLLSFTCILSVPYAAYLQNRVAKLQEEKSNLCRLRGDNYICNGSIPHFGNANSRTIALYTVVFTISMPFLFYKYLDRLPPIKRLLKSTKISKELFMPFLFYKYLDCLPPIKRLLKSTKISKELFMPFLFYKYLDRLPPIKRLLKSTKISKEEVPLEKRVAYMVDVCFSIYPYAKLLALLFATIFLIGFGGLALYAVSESSFTEALWLAWTFVADSGNHADRVGIGPRIVSVSISSGGMLIFAMMLGLVSDAISEKVDSLRKGKSEVIERDHVLILGWGDKLGSLLKQLAIANKSIGGGVVVVLAERDKEEMEIDIGKLEFDFMGTSVICRSGSPLILADLKKVSVSKARAIIVLASHENADQSDARALRVVLSLTGVKEGLRGHVVVEMSDIDNEPLVKLVGGDLIETVVAHDVIGRLMIQCALQPGLAQIWEDILGFENAEFYIKRWPELDGLRFKDVLISFPDAVPCGIKVAAEGGKIDINPDDDYVLKEGDEVLVIAEDDDTYAPDHLPEVRRGFFPKIPDLPKYPEKILFCGWRRDIDDMIMVLEAFLAPGSQLWMFNEVPEKEREKKLTDGGLDVSRLENIKLVHREGNAVIRRHLENLPLETFDSILILADESLEDSVVQADSRSLATLLLIRDIQSKRLPHKDTKSNSLRFSGFCHGSWIRQMQQASDKSIIISEILDSRTRNLVSVSRISDYVLSNELVSMALAMVAEDKQINRVLEELFAEEGSEMCIKPAEFYLFDQEELCFYDIMIRGRQRQEIVIGYRTANAECAIINPPQKSEPRKWAIDDVFVVISSGE